MRVVLLGGLSIFIFGVVVALLETRGLLDLISSASGVSMLIFGVSLLVLMAALVKRVWRLIRGV